MASSSSSSSSSSSHLSLPQPAILLSTSGTSSAPGHLAIVSLSTTSITSPLLPFKPYVSSSPHAVSIVPPSPATNTEGLLATLEEGKNLLHIHSIPLYPAVSPLTTRFIPPQPLSCLALSPDGSLLCAGASDGHAYLWEVASGRLLAVWEPHFRNVTVVRWDTRGHVIATGGEDGRICVWSVAGLVHPTTSISADGRGSNPSPYATFSTHLLAITSLAFTPASGSFPSKLRLWSASMDGTVKLWDLRTRTLLTNFQLDDKAGKSEVTSLIADPTGRFCFAATASGRLERIDLYRSVGGQAAWEARGGGGMEDVETVGDDRDGLAKTGVQLSSPANSLALLPSSSHLLIGTSSPPTLQILDVRSMQIIRTTALSETPGSTAKVTNLIAFYRSTSSDTRGSKVAAKRRVVADQLERALKQPQQGDDDEEEDQVYWCEVPSGNENELDFLIPPSLSSAGQRRVIPAPAAAVENPQSANSRSQSSAAVYDLQNQVESLQAQLAQAQKWNKEMWTAVVAKGVNGAGAKAV